MNSIFKKMNYKDQKLIHSINSPDSFETVLKEMAAIATIKKKINETDTAEFIIAFCTKQEEVDKLAIIFSKALKSDGLLWFAYPKGTSKKYKCDFNRDTGWDVLGKYGFEPVRMIAIDEDWSALRFRKVEYIKSMTRSFAITKEGKERIAKKKL
ncbi:MAG: hypothetical protein ACKVOW_13875 [Chitinophagaceae bacterium]